MAKKTGKNGSTDRSKKGTGRKRGGGNGSTTAPTITTAPAPETLRQLLPQFAEWQRIRGYSERTITDRDKCVGAFIDWADVRSVTLPHQVTRPVLESYQRHLYHHRKRDGSPLNSRTQHGRLSAVRAFFKYLARQHVVMTNPSADLELPRMDKRLPAPPLTASEAERVLAQPDTGDLLGLRDRAMLETLYSAGIRRAELANLSVWDIDSERGTLLVRLGKGRKDRVVAIGERATGWIHRYVDEVRPELVVPPDDGTLFLSALGEAISKDHLSSVVGKYVEAAGIGKRGACHLFRHTMATLMLEGGADIRHIQSQLGHAELSTTAIYAQVSIRVLKEVHTRTHPGAGVEERGEVS